MLFIPLIQAFILASAVLASDGFYKMDFSVAKGSKLVDAISGLFEDIGDGFKNLDLGKRADGAFKTNVTNERVFYVSSLSIGSPAKEVKVLIDTGSSDLWVMSTKNPQCKANGGDINCETYGTYNEDKSETFKNNDTDFYISYLDQTYANGTWGQDSVKLADGFTIEDANFAVADDSTSNVGVFGIGFKKLESTQQLYDNAPIQMKNQGLIKKNAYSLYLTPSNSQSGSVLFGGIDHAKYEGDLVDFDIVEEQGNHVYLQIPLTSITIEMDNPPTNTQGVAPSSTAVPSGGSGVFKREDALDIGENALLDSGTTLTYLPSNLVDKLVKQISSDATYSYQLGGYSVPCSARQQGNSATFNFDNGKKEIKVPMHDLVIEAGNNGSTGEAICMAGFISSDHVILGDNFLRHAYSVFNLDDKTISLAQMKNTDDEEIEVIS